MASLDEAEKVQSQGESADNVIKSSVGSNALVNVLLAGSLSKLWTLIEGLQVVTHLPLFAVKSPGNVNAFVKFLQEIGGFNFVDSDDFTSELLYFPEADAMSLNF